MEENKNEIMNEAQVEQKNPGAEFENLGKHEIEIGRRAHEGHKHHRHHHSSHSGSSHSSSKGKSHSKKRRSDKHKPSSGFWENFSYYSIRIWVLVLTAAIVLLTVWNFDLTAKLNVHSDQLENSSGAVIQMQGTSGGYTIPEYWKGAVDTAADKVQALMDEAGRDAVVFAWFSDLHFDGNSKNTATGAITAAVMDRCNIPFALSTGDVLTQSPLADEKEVENAYKLVYEMLSPIGPDRLLQVEGNHDGAYGQVDLDGDGEIEDGESYCYNVSEEKLYNMMFRQHSTDTRRVYGDESSWYYIDDAASKTRFVMLNTLWTEQENDSEGIAKNNKMFNKGFGQAQVDWLVNEALSFETEGWSVVLVSHVPLDSDQLRDRSVVHGVLEAYANNRSYSGEYGTEGQWDHVKVSVDFSGKNSAQILGYYSGHIHADTITNNFSFPQITITPNSNIPYDENEEDREWGTDNEVAVDFVVINKRTGEVNIVRLGVGSDRSYNFK